MRLWKKTLLRNFWQINDQRTLVYRIILLIILFFFWKNPAYRTLFHHADLFIFEKKSYLQIIPSCIFINFLEMFYDYEDIEGVCLLKHWCFACLSLNCTKNNDFCGTGGFGVDCKVLEFPSYMIIPSCRIIEFGEIFHPTELFHPIELFDWLEYVGSYFSKPFYFLTMYVVG